MNKTKFRKLRQAQKLKDDKEKKEQRIAEERKTILVLRKKQYKRETKARSEKFFNDRAAKWNEQRAHENLAIPSIITNEWGKCTKKRSPLDDY